jgi:hypothetical protein
MAPVMTFIPHVIWVPCSESYSAAVYRGRGAGRTLGFWQRGGIGMNRLSCTVGALLAAIECPGRRSLLTPAADLDAMHQLLQPADVVLVEGVTAASAARSSTSLSRPGRMRRSTWASAAASMQKGAPAPFLKPTPSTAYARSSSGRLKGITGAYAASGVNCRRCPVRNRVRTDLATATI